ncbi:MAG: DUF4214 domain-containing protein [Lachnospiraceae bacterium]|nr:DUF4214 domain-containing protein [Lachnospiraceae bacterium]
MKYRFYKKLTRLLIVPMLSASLIATVLPAGAGSLEVKAEEISQNGIENSNIENSDIENSDIENSDTGFAADKLNYVYLENKTVTSPGTQTVMISYGDEETTLSQAKLTVRNYLTGSVKEYSMTESFENTDVFTLDYTAADRGIYEVTDAAVVTDDGISEKLHLLSTGMEHIYFGVDEEFEETSADGEALQTESDPGFDPEDVSMQIVSLGADGSSMTTSDINEITEAIKAGADSAGQSRMATESELGTEARDYVVMLDPGHDATHAGARKNGLQEEALTLKIAQYCKAELEQYKHVKVYMTREDSGCPLPGSTSVQDNRNRVATAASVGADIYVSIHLNSAGSGSAKGAQVFYPNSGYRPDIGSEGANLATQIQRQLVALGLQNRGISIRNSGDNSRYPDGSLADYYGVIKNSKLSGFPGVIVEHAYVSNASDAAFLKSESNLQALGIADATGIAQYLGLSKGPDRVADPAKVAEFVRRLYDKCLNRQPDETGLQDWVNTLCDFELDGVDTAYGFVFSTEMTNRNLSDDEFVEILYNVFLDRSSDAVGKGNWIYYLQNGVSREGVFIGFANSKEFAGICDQYGIDQGTATARFGRDRSLDLTTFVARLYTKALGRNYDVNGINDWCNAVLDGREDISDVSTKGFFHSPEFVGKNLDNSEYIKTLYRTFFDREYDQAGYDDWMNQLNSGMMSRDQVLLGFANSKEFAALKMKYGIK